MFPLVVEKLAILGLIQDADCADCELNWVNMQKNYYPYLIACKISKKKSSKLAGKTLQINLPDLHEVIQKPVLVRWKIKLSFSQKFRYTLRRVN